MNAREVHRRLRAFVRETPAPQGGWLSGSCWILARALHEVLGCPMVAVTGSSIGLPSDLLRPFPERQLDQVQHVAVLCRGVLVVDGDGVSTTPQLLKRWREEELIKNARLVPWDAYCDTNARGGGIPSGSQRQVEQLARELRTRLEAR